MALTTVPAGLLGASAALTNIGPNGVTPAYLSSTAQYTGFKNRLINGCMRIDQRNAGASVTPATSGDYNLDRWFSAFSQASKFTVQQNAAAVTLPTGFVNYLGVTSSSAYSITATDFFLINQKIEGLNVADLAWGTASAATVTLSFWVRSSLTGTFGGAINNSAGTRSYPFSYTINSANTWEQKSVTIAGDTTGTWLTTNGIGIQLRFGFGVGSTFSNTAGSWAAGNYLSVTGATSVVGTNGATFYITGVQLEVGSTATSFDYRDYGRELMMCQRYYQQVGNVGTIWTGDGNAYRNTTSLSVTMRAAPTASITINSSSSNFLNNGSYPNVGTATTGYQLNVANNLGGPAAIISWNTTIKLTAEL